MLKLTNVTKQFGSFIAVNDLSLEIGSGSIFGLLGPNGAGKTTMLRMIMGLIRPSSGSIDLFGKHSPSDKPVQAKLGYMPQQLAVYPSLSVYENICFFGRLYGMTGSELKNRAESLIEMIELRSKRNVLVENLSGGMIRRAMLATVLVHSPQLVILDEPTAGVDPALRIRFWDWFGELAESGTSILITTHHIAEASNCHEVVFLREGKLLERGTPENLMKQYKADDLEQAFVFAIKNSEQKTGEKK